MIYNSLDYQHKYLSITTQVVDNFTMPNNHFHPRYELYYLINGSRYYFIDNSTYKINAGNIVLIPPNTLHKTMDTGKSHGRLLFNIDKNFLPFIDVEKLLSDTFTNNYVLELPYKLHNQIENIFSQIDLELSKKLSYFETSIQSYLMQLLLLLSRYQQSVNLNNKELTPINSKMYEIIRYIKNNYSKSITLTSIADEFFVSRHYLSRAFKKSTGFTIVEFIHSTRIIEAQKLLTNSNKQIIDIALSVGFNSTSNFGKVFKSITGISPLNYRKIYK